MERPASLRDLLRALQDIEADENCVPQTEFHRLGRLTLRQTFTG
jgi:hypothetical protein